MHSNSKEVKRSYNTLETMTVDCVLHPFLPNLRNKAAGSTAASLVLSQAALDVQNLNIPFHKPLGSDQNQQQCIAVLLRQYLFTVSADVEIDHSCDDCSPFEADSYELLLGEFEEESSEWLEGEFIEVPNGNEEEVIKFGQFEAAVARAEVAPVNSKVPSKAKARSKAKASSERKPKSRSRRVKSR